MKLGGDTDITGKLDVTGDTTLGGATSISGLASLLSNLAVKSGGKITIEGSPSVVIENVGGAAQISIGGSVIKSSGTGIQIDPATGPAMTLTSAGLQIVGLPATDAATHQPNLWMNPSGQVYLLV